MNYDKYNEYVNKMPDPIMPSELPRKKIDFRAIIQYAEEKGVKVTELSEEEKMAFMK